MAIGIGQISCWGIEPTFDGKKFVRYVQLGVKLGKEKGPEVEISEDLNRFP